MKPVDYFSNFEEAKRNFISASKKHNLKDKLEAIQKLTNISHQIIQNNYHTSLLALFREQSNAHSLKEAREMFATWSCLIEEQVIEGLHIADQFFTFNDYVLEKIDMLTLLEERSDAMSKDIIEDIQKDELLHCISEGVKCTLEGIAAPFSLVVNMIKNFVPTSHFLKEEKIIQNLN